MKTSSTPSLPALRSTRLLEQVREMIRYRHYSLSTEKNSVVSQRFSEERELFGLEIRI